MAGVFCQRKRGGVSEKERRGGIFLCAKGPPETFIFSRGYSGDPEKKSGGNGDAEKEHCGSVRAHAPAAVLQL